MNPSVQCIFERTLAGFVLIALILGALMGTAYLQRSFRKRWPNKPQKLLSPRAEKIATWSMATWAGLMFGGLLLSGCYYVGKEILANLGICHLK